MTTSGPVSLPPQNTLDRAVQLLLNAAHALDHLVLLIFASAVSLIAIDLGVDRWEDLMPYTTGAFLMFGLGSIPAGRLGDLWGRRKSMLLFFFGTAASCLLVAVSQESWHLAVSLTILGIFASIYHPVGIPMLLRHASRPGAAIGWNNLAGNLGVALAALITGITVSLAGWRAAFILPGLLALLLGLAFMRLAPQEPESPAKGNKQGKDVPFVFNSDCKRALIVMTLAACTSSILFNFTTNSNTELFKVKLDGLLQSPAQIGFVLALLYAIAGVSQVVMGRLTDRYAIRPLFLGVVSLQVFFLLVAAFAEGWLFYAAGLGFMAAIFGAIPFSDVIMVRFVDDRLRSRVAGMRLGISFFVGSAAVLLLGPVVKAVGFQWALLGLAIVASLTLLVVVRLPAVPNVLNAATQTSHS
ncbi:MAG: MFS transporter [Burkholderiaceae bacterium]|nr:MFS transporter [Burkholderiaceae bacterium]HCO56735.1 MFS transporter [Burkholderiales bacterium]